MKYVYIHDLNGKLVGRQDAASGKMQYYQLNGHGDVVALVDEQGQKLNEYRYDIWGQPLEEKETVPNILKYSGEYWDKTTGLQYLRARWYDPSMGRFINEDTYEGDIKNPLSLNLYLYVANNPLIYSDPTGHEYGRVSDFVSDFGGTIVHGKETIGYNVTFKSVNGISKNETVYSNTMPHYLVSKDTQVIYKSIFRKYADISITGDTQRFYYDENKIVNGNMYAERAEFYEKMGASFKAVRYSFEKSESEAKVENFLSGFYVNTVLDITTGGVKASLWVATTLAAIEHSG
ncbi:RHS repeat-associated core domain-containing protein [Paenibacillus sp. ACRRX]|uniref:RHS repeat-associated core domain-containing protein n=1 Tax=Paenibacillus sp. ACRRX TaxID=2918206 RepID=UPI001EF4059A|nr:RHS repeat-associated core domain-containing protein [Paenibacillus sp. ACRRX]MCG7406167.1 RHS repeat-associated core domain-containing protein [Paenibacillus sp. ACRRX]